MSEKKEILYAIKTLVNAGTKRKDITVLQCNTEYPTPFKDVNLRAMVTFKRKFKTNYGISDHTLGIEVPIAASAMGATIVEKHFTLNRNVSGPDHKASILPKELSRMIKSIRNIEQALGSSIKTITTSEKKNIKVARKSLVAIKTIEKGELFSEKNITVKRPGNGLPAEKYFKIIGKRSRRRFLKDQLIVL